MTKNYLLLLGISVILGSIPRSARPACNTAGVAKLAAPLSPQVLSEQIQRLTEAKNLVAKELETITPKDHEFTKDEKNALQDLIPAPKKKMSANIYKRRVKALSDLLEMEIRKRQALLQIDALSAQMPESKREDILRILRRSMKATGKSSFTDSEVRLLLEADTVRRKSVELSAKLHPQSRPAVSDKDRPGMTKERDELVNRFAEIQKTLGAMFATTALLGKALQSPDEPGGCCDSGCFNCRFSDGMREANNDETLELDSVSKDSLDWIRKKDNLPSPKIPTTLGFYQVKKSLIDVLPYLDDEP